MKYERRTPKPPRVSEPVQVYLHRPDQDRLKRLAERLGTSKSDVLRRGLEALERQVTDPADHPVLRLVGIGASEPPEGTRREDGLDAARDHDRVLADSEIASWSAPEGVNEAKKAGDEVDGS
jgi:hypothetical protein